jgi:hypothetical protein
MGGFLNLGLLQGTMGKGLNTLKVKPSNCDVLFDYVHIVTISLLCFSYFICVKEFSTLIFYLNYINYMQDMCIITMHTPVCVRFLLAIKQMYMILCWCNCIRIFNQPQMYVYRELLLL